MEIIKGHLEMLELANHIDPIPLKNFARESVDNLQLKPTSISKRLGELVAIEAIKETVVKTKTGKKSARI